MIPYFSDHANISLFFLSLGETSYANMLGSLQNGGTEISLLLVSSTN